MSATQAASQAMTAMDRVELEVLIRRIVREELTSALDEWYTYQKPTAIEPGSPLDEDLRELLQMKEEGTLKLLSHEEVWGANNVSQSSQR